MKTLVHAFVTSRVDYYNSVLALSPMTITDKLQRVLNSAARLITATGKFDRGLLQLLNDHLQWLDVPQRVQYKLALMVHRCLGRLAPSFVPRRLLCAALFFRFRSSSRRCCPALRENRYIIKCTSTAREIYKVV